MTFEEFQASRREVTDVAAASGHYHTETPTPGFIYAADLVIEQREPGKVVLVIGGDEREESIEDLPALERDLYAYASGDGWL